MKNIKINFEINTLEDFHIGSGLEKIGVYDDGQYKDKDSQPAIKNETFKGLLKQSCRELKNIGLGTDEIFNLIFDFDGQTSIDIDIFLDKAYYDKNINNPFIVHTFTSVKQKTKRAKENSLHNIEFASKGIKFNGEINFLLKDELQNEIKKDDKDISEKIQEFLEMGLKNLKWWGGYRRRGFGKIKIEEIKTNIEKIEEKINVKSEKNIYKTISIILELKEDVTIAGKASAGNIIETLDYIPATSILGMTRFVLMSTQSEVFDYLDDKNVQVSNFYPTPKDKDFEEIHTAFISPIPLSLRQNKATEIKFGNNFKDKNIPHWALDKKVKTSFKDMVKQDSLIDNNSASQDDGSDKSFSGGYIYTSKNHLNKENILENSRYIKVKKELHMRNHINPKTQSSKEDDGLFSQEKIKRGTCFKGEIIFKNSKDAEKFKEHFSNYLNGKNTFNVGRGSKPVKIVSYKFLDKDENNIELSDNGFTITLLSDTILFDKNLNRLKSLNTEVLAKELGIKENDIVLKSEVSSNRIIQNYNGLSGLRRFSDMAIKKGSVYHFEYKDISKDKGDIIIKLQNLEKNGIGIRKFEGFGQIKINYPIHFAKKSKVNLNNKLNELKESKISSFYKIKLENKNKLFNEAKKINLSNTKTVVNNLLSILEANKDNIKIDEYLKKQAAKENTKDKYENFKKEWDKDKNIDKFILVLEMLKYNKENKEASKKINTEISDEVNEVNEVNEVSKFKVNDININEVVEVDDNFNKLIKNLQLSKNVINNLLTKLKNPEKMDGALRFFMRQPEKIEYESFKEIWDINKEKADKFILALEILKGGK